MRYDFVHLIFLTHVLYSILFIHVVTLMVLYVYIYHMTVIDMYIAKNHIKKQLGISYDHLQSPT